MDKHSKRNASALEATRRFLPANIWTTSYASFAKAACFLPEKLVQHLWANKALWWCRLDPTLIVKTHIADLRSKCVLRLWAPLAVLAVLELLLLLLLCVSLRCCC